MITTWSAAESCEFSAPEQQQTINPSTQLPD